MNEYTASNGTRVRLDEAGDLDISSPSGWVGICGGHVLVALREFFQHERDEELGRWRWPENAHFVVYAEDDGVHNVVNENTGLSLMATRGGVKNHDDQHADAARAYFEAHPERKPWEDAKTGEVWALKTADGREEAYAVMWVRESDVVFENNNWRYPLDSDQVKSARRIWPEGDAS